MYIYLTPPKKKNTAFFEKKERCSPLISCEFTRTTLYGNERTF